MHEAHTPTADPAGLTPSHVIPVGVPGEDPVPPPPHVFPGTEPIEASAPEAPPEPSADEPGKPSWAERRASRKAASQEGEAPVRGGLPWDTRVKIAIVLSFVVLVAVLVMNRMRAKGKDEKGTPTNSIRGPKSPSYPKKTPEKDDKSEEPASEDDKKKEPISPPEPEGAGAEKQPPLPPSDAGTIEKVSSPPAVPSEEAPPNIGQASESVEKPPASDEAAKVTPPIVETPPPTTHEPSPPAGPTPSDAAAPPLIAPKPGDTTAPPLVAPKPEGTALGEAGETPKSETASKIDAPQANAPEVTTPPPPIATGSEAPPLPAEAVKSTPPMPTAGPDPAGGAPATPPADGPAPDLAGTPSAPGQLPPEAKPDPMAPGGPPPAAEAPAPGLPAPAESLPTVPPASQPTPVPVFSKAPTTTEPAAPTDPLPPGGGFPLPNAGLTRSASAARRANPSVDLAAARTETLGAATFPGPAAPEDGTIHVVRRGENFWTISRYHYASGRFYRALWYANRDVAKAPEDLYVGTPLRIPPIDQLNPDYIDAPRTARAEGRPSAELAPSPESRRDLRAERASATRGNEGYGLPLAKNVPERTLRRAASPAYRVYVVRGRNETVRSIARDQLGDSEREDEIYRLNRDALDGDGYRLQVGMSLKIPNEPRR